MRPWTPEDTAELRRLHPKMTARQLAGHFGRTERAIHVKCFHLGLKKGYDHALIRLTPEQKRWLRANYPHMRNEICAQYLGVSVRTMIRNARYLGLLKTPQFMKECQLGTARIAKRKRAENGTNPPKGWYSPNLRKGRPYQFKPKDKSRNEISEKNPKTGQALDLP